MSIFLCARCDETRDSDDGCAEAPNNGLYCIDCMNEMEDADNRTRHTYDEIYDTLTKAGCPSDIAAELAREKSK